MPDQSTTSDLVERCCRNRNVEVVRRAYEQFRATGQFVAEIVTPDLVWDMSNFRGWPEQQIYEGVQGARTFLREWTAAWDEWELEVDALHDAGDKVVALLRQRGRSKLTGTPVEMSLAQVWTFRDDKQTRMETYSDPTETLEAVGLAG
jgi:ketosteroid isomerase-like protein